MSRLRRTEQGAALVWVLVVITAGLLIVGAVSALGAVNMRVARFETDHTLALYAAESGINHALALLHQGDDADEINSKLEQVELPDGGTYTATVTGSTEKYTIESTGQYRGRERIVSINGSTGGGSVFLDYVLREGDELFNARVDIRVPKISSHPEYANAQPVGCHRLSNLQPGENTSIYRVDGTCNIANLKLENVTVFVQSLHASGDVSMESSNLFVGEHFTIWGGTGLTFGGSSDNNIHVYGDFNMGGANLMIQRRESHDAMPWDYIHVGRQILIESSLFREEEADKRIPHLVFTSECDRGRNLPFNIRYRDEYRCVEFRGSALDFVGGIYAPEGTVKVDGDPRAERGVGSIVAKDLEFKYALNEDSQWPYDECDMDDTSQPCQLRDSLLANWPAVAERMQTVKLGNEGGLPFLDWTVLK